MKHEEHPQAYLYGSARAKADSANLETIAKTLGELLATAKRIESGMASAARKEETAADRFWEIPTSKNIRLGDARAKFLSLVELAGAGDQDAMAQLEAAGESYRNQVKLAVDFNIRDAAKRCSSAGSATGGSKALPSEIEAFAGCPVSFSVALHDLVCKAAGTDTIIRDIVRIGKTAVENCGEVRGVPGVVARGLRAFEFTIIFDVYVCPIVVAKENGRLVFTLSKDAELQAGVDRLKARTAGEAIGHPLSEAAREFVKTVDAVENARSARAARTSEFKTGRIEAMAESIAGRPVSFSHVLHALIWQSSDPYGFVGDVVGVGCKLLEDEGGSYVFGFPAAEGIPHQILVVDEGDTLHFSLLTPLPTSTARRNL